MKVFVTFVLLTRLAAEGKPLWEAYGRPTPPSIMTRSSNHKSGKECDFPMDVYLIQDATSSFNDDLAEMKANQLPKMHQQIERRHPGSRYGLMTFQDKPIVSLGQSGNYCLKFNAPLSTNFTVIEEEYKRLNGFAGGDMPENHFGALYAAASSNLPEWGDVSVPKLIVVITDAHPHFDADGLNKYGLRPFEDKWDDSDLAFQQDVCIGQYYPSPDQVKKALKSRKTYVAFLASDDGSLNGIVSRSWKWFNSLIGQTDDFFANIRSDSSNFWSQLEKILGSVESAECGDCKPGRLVREENIHGHPVRVVAEDFNNELSNEEILTACRA